jgi:hypothetical protein
MSNGMTYNVQGFAVSGGFYKRRSGNKSPIEKFFVEDKHYSLNINVVPGQKLNSITAVERCFSSRPTAAKPLVICILE